MKIKRLDICNFKSLKEVSILNPNPFTVFAGSNASGKSNIFEALELFSFITRHDIQYALKVFGSYDDLLGRYATNHSAAIEFVLETENIECRYKAYNPSSNEHNNIILKNYVDNTPLFQAFAGDLISLERFIQKQLINKPDNSAGNSALNADYLLFSQEFARLFLNNKRISRQKYLDDSRLDFFASNLEKVLRRLLQNEQTKEELLDLLSLWVPGFENLVVVKDEISGNFNIQWFESGSKKPFHRSLMSDGTLNIIALLTALYQTDKPQFLCIEEPENGLNPKVIHDLVELMRNRAKQTGQYIWLSTHSETLVSVLKPEELILVDKVDGCTRIKQFQDMNLHGLSLDKAWLSNVLGGGLPW